MHKFRGRSETFLEKKLITLQPIYKTPPAPETPKLQRSGEEALYPRLIHPHQPPKQVWGEERWTPSLTPPRDALPGLSGDLSCAMNSHGPVPCSWPSSAVRAVEFIPVTRRITRPEEKACGSYITTNPSPAPLTHTLFAMS